MSIRNYVNGLKVGTACTHLGLTVHPLISTFNGTTSYLTLDEALSTNRFRVGEISMNGSVPELKVVNTLSQPVLLLDGEELIGAKQNRVLNLTIMVPANTEITIPVSCVEAGRWQHRSDNFMATDRAQFARGRAAKLSQVSDSLRLGGTRFSNQTEVWREIEEKSVRMSVESRTGAMSELYERTKGRLDEFVRAVPHHDKQIGAIFSIGGRVSGLDAFDSAKTYAKAAPKLIRSHAVDALEIPATTLKSEPANETVRDFLTEIAAMEVTRFKGVGLGDDLRFNGPNIVGAALEISGQVVHIVSFPADLYQQNAEGPTRHARMTRARMRRTFH